MDALYLCINTFHQINHSVRLPRFVFREKQLGSFEYEVPFPPFSQPPALFRQPAFKICLQSLSEEPSHKSNAQTFNLRRLCPTLRLFQKNVRLILKYMRKTIPDNLYGQQKHFWFLRKSCAAVVK